MLDPKKIKRLDDKQYRDAYMANHVRAGIAYQIQAVREQCGLSQAEFAAKIGKPQSVVSRLENTEYGKVTVQTLLDVAQALDIALLVRFVDYAEFLARAGQSSPDDLKVPPFSATVWPIAVPIVAGSYFTGIPTTGRRRDARLSTGTRGSLWTKDTSLLSGRSVPRYEPSTTGIPMRIPVSSAWDTTISTSSSTN